MTVERQADGSILVRRDSWRDWLPWVRTWRVTSAVVDASLIATVRRQEAERTDALHRQLLTSFETCTRKRACAIATTWYRIGLQPEARRN